MDSIIESLMAAGYFRARISTLSDFDKIIGGMAWAMQVFSYDLNIDVFYIDTFDLGQKIALTERLVMVLLAIKCPYRVEPHQIVGLDYANLVPVLKWLIKRCEEVRREQEAFNRLLALRHYHRVTNTTPERAKWCHVVPTRFLNRTQLKGETNSGKKLADGFSAELDQTTANLIARINEDFKDNQQVSFLQLATLMRAGNQEASRQVIGQSLEDTRMSDDPGESDDGDCDAISATDNQENRRNFDPELQAICDTEQNSELSEAERSWHMELDGELLATNQKILNLLKKVDSMPSELEICQYQRRYIELHQQLISKNKDVKKLFDLYNTLDVTKHYLVKEITLLDSISSSLQLTNDSLSNCELFLKQFNDIIKKIEDIKEDMRSRLDKLRQKCEMLNVEYAELLDEHHSE